MTGNNSTTTLYIQSPYLLTTSIDPGSRFYSFKYGADIELISLDTSKRRIVFAERYLGHPNHRSFIVGVFLSAGRTMANTVLSSPSILRRTGTLQP